MVSFAVLCVMLLRRACTRFRVAVVQQQQRSLCSKPSSAVAFGAGLSGGGIGALVGIGGGAVMVPIMTAFGRMTQHQAIGTSSAAVAGTGLAAVASFGTAGALDYVAALALGSTAMLTARFGARLTSAFNPVQLQRAFACFQLCIAPLVPLKGVLARSSADEAVASPTNTASASRDVDVAPPSSALQYVQLACVGSVAGVASGMFGIGGGLLLTPALCLLTDMPHATVLGTTLASMAS